MTHSLYILDDSPWFEWIRLHSTDSTIDFLKHYRPVSPKDMILVTADFQTAGRGQAGNSWESEAGKNLLFGLLFHPREVEANRQFILSQAVALSICETLSDYAEDIRIKWPNDIYWKDRKICGMLPSSFPVQKKKTQAISYDSRLTSLTIFYFYQLPARLVTGNPYT